MATKTDKRERTPSTNGGAPDKPEVIANKGGQFEIDSKDPDNWLGRGIVAEVPEQSDGPSVDPSAGPTVSNQ